MKIYIIDASFILTSFLGQKYLPQAAEKLRIVAKAAIRGKVTLQSIPLLPIEVANGLRFSNLDKPTTDLSLKKFFQLPIKYFSLNETQISKILNLSFDLQTTVYDTTYHFLAILLDGIMLTCDKEYYDKAKTLDHIELITA